MESLTPAHIHTVSQELFRKQSHVTKKASEPEIIYVCKGHREGVQEQGPQTSMPQGQAVTVGK